MNLWGIWRGATFCSDGSGTTGVTLGNGWTKRGSTATLAPSASVTPQAAMVAIVIVLGRSNA